jgi:nuclear GTP-binding protein
MKKEANKMKALGIFKKKKKTEIDLPNLYPYKQRIIEAFERKKKTLENEKKLSKLKKKEEYNKLDAEELEKSLAKAVIYEQNMQEIDPNNNTLGGNKKKGASYYKELNKVLEAADIILEVLDARDPLSCRNRDLEAKILGMPGEKKIILVLNKIDLVPQHVAEKWHAYLKREFAVVLFKANTQNQNDHLGSNKMFNSSLGKKEELTEDILSSSKAVGADHLLQLIKNYSKTDGIKQAVTVGIIGYPNVGKSSVINSLKKSKATGVSSTPGFTKHLQEVYLDSKVRLLDCPGVVFSTDDEKLLVLRNIIKIDDIVDPIAPIDEILKRIEHNQLLIRYQIADFSNATEFLTNLALRRGKLQKAGIVDLEAAARIVLNDWNSGKIEYFLTPPTTSDNEMGIES